jgi:hypothetical protein
MSFYNTFRQPYLDGDDGVNLGGGSTEGQQSQSTTTGAGETQEQMFKLKYNHEEREIPYSQAVELAQKGMNYDKVMEKLQGLENNPGLSWINAQAQRYGMTVDEFVNAMKQQEEQEQLNQLVQQNIPQEYAQEMLENRRFRQQYQSEREAMQQRIKTEAMYQEFLDSYPDINPDNIPQEVWNEVGKGRSLLDAYVRHENKTLRDQLTKFQTKEQVTAANQANAQVSTGSVKGGGAPESGFISREVYDANKGNQNWMQKNYDNIIKSMKKWGK